MFYYLLDKSSFLEQLQGKNKQTSILIYGSIIYIIFHFILSNFKKKNMLKYFWVIFCIDVVAICLNTNMTTVLQFNNLAKNEVPKIIKSNLKNQEVKNKIKKTVTFADDVINETIQEKKSIEKKKKKRKSTPISELVKENKIFSSESSELLPIGNDIDTDKEEEINITLADLQSDGGSDIDLESFEKNYFD
tara:strand:+ start:39 stop:611 length:573 start_codon:yes stop_codon:yes gene_type:complete